MVERGGRIEPRTDGLTGVGWESLSVFWRRVSSRVWLRGENFPMGGLLSCWNMNVCCWLCFLEVSSGCLDSVGQDIEK